MVDESEKTYDVVLTPQFLSDLDLCTLIARKSVQLSYR